MITRLVPILLLLPLLFGSVCTNAAEPAATPNRQFVSLSIDNMTIETEGLTEASLRLAESVDRLALSLERLSTGSEALSEADRQVLMGAVKSVNDASAALARLADELPQAAQRFSQQLPQLVENARQPIAELASALQSARDGIYAITESLPQASDSARALVDSTLDSALVKISAYTVVLIAALALALIAVVWFVYRQYLAPIAARLEPLAVAPGHFAELARHMKETSDNLLALQAGAPDSNASDSAETQPVNATSTAGKPEARPRPNSDEAGNRDE